MKTEAAMPHPVVRIEHLDIPMPDGCRLGARIWLPAGAASEPVPAILEYIPYRKNDLCVPEDETNGRYLAENGYAYVRLDLRGAGDSEGLMLDEYLEQELQDGCDAIQWIAEQPWCDGAVGMIGISWGGFNGLQIAALQPPALKAVISVCSTDDRYADDVHYMGGCVLIDNLSWAAQMFGRNSLPPDPRHRGAAWRALWQERLEHSGHWLKNWLDHQTRDDFWKHGSICENYGRVRVPIYAISGWADGYCRAVFRLMQNLEGPRKGLIGPWAHKYPHVGKPGPAIGFREEALRWWDHWLKGKATGIMDEPMLRLYMQDPVPPRSGYATRPGRWIAEPGWPSPNVERTAFTLIADGTLRPGRAAPEPQPALTIRSPLTVGFAAGKWCSYAQPGDQPVDQRLEAGGSLLFATEPLTEPLEIAGDPVLTLACSVDRPVASVAVRLEAVAADGAATRVTYGVFNLTHRTSHEAPEPLVPGQLYTVRVPLKPVAQRFVAGQRLQLAISTSYFPMIWPAPEPVTMTVHPADCVLDLPVRRPVAADATLPEFDPPQPAVSRTETIEAPDLGWRVIHDHARHAVTMEIGDGAGVYRLPGEDITVTKKARERYSVADDDPATVTGETVWEFGLARGDWSIRTITETTLTADPQNFHIRARLRAWEADELVYEQHWDEPVPRRLV